MLSAARISSGSVPRNPLASDARDSSSHESSSGASSASSPRRSRPHYLDYQATTPLDPRVLDAMLPFLCDRFGNPHSRTHSFGWEAEHFVEESRRKVADLIGAQAKEIVFTSGATESNNLAIKGVAAFYGQDGKKRHIITTQIEHKCVLSSCRDLQEHYGWEVTYLPVNGEGLIDLEKVGMPLMDCQQRSADRPR